MIQAFRAALAAFDQRGEFGEPEYKLLRALVTQSQGRRGTDGDLLDGLVNLFFERHVMSDARRRELLALNDDDLERAVRHRFRQVLADAQDDYKPYRALRAQVRAALQAVTVPPAEAAWPARIREKDHFSAAAVEAAVCALARERRVLPSVAEATKELFQRYAEGPAAPDQSQDEPEVLRRRIDGQRLAAGILRVLTAEEKDLLRHVLDGGSVEDWAEQADRSRATAYRMLSRLKALCRLEFSERSNRTQLEVLNALKGGLGS